MEADISIWRKTGHFYFALTVLVDAETVHVDFFKFLITRLDRAQTVSTAIGSVKSPLKMTIVEVVA